MAKVFSNKTESKKPPKTVKRNSKYEIYREGDSPENRNDTVRNRNAGNPIKSKKFTYSLKKI